MHKDLSNTNPEGKKSAEIDYFIVLVGSILILTIVLAINPPEQDSATEMEIFFFISLLIILIIYEDIESI